MRYHESMKHSQPRVVALAATAQQSICMEVWVAAATLVSLLGLLAL